MQLIRIACALALLATTAHAATDGLQAGMVLNKDTWQLAEELLPPEILEHYKRGEYTNPIAEWKDGDVRWSAAFLSATQENKDRFEVTADGTMVEKSTGQRPPFIYGFPFPVIDPADPQAAVKIIWNYYYGYWSNGSRRNVTGMMWLGRKGVERAAMVEVHFRQYDGQPPDYRPKENPNGVLQQFLATTLEPNDLQGTTALT